MCVDARPPTLWAQGVYPNGRIVCWRPWRDLEGPRSMRLSQGLAPPSDLRHSEGLPSPLSCPGLCGHCPEPRDLLGPVLMATSVDPGGFQGHGRPASFPVASQGPTGASVRGSLLRPYGY